MYMWRRHSSTSQEKLSKNEYFIEAYLPLDNYSRPFSEMVIDILTMIIAIVCQANSTYIIDIEKMTPSLKL